MSGRFAITGARIFDGDNWHDEAALLVSGDHGRRASCRRRAWKPESTIVEAGGGMLAPGFVDLQVNGGGGLMLNDRPDVETIRTICAAHAPFGTTALLPTLITDTPAQTSGDGRGRHRGGAAQGAGLPRPASRRPASVGEPQGRA